MDRKGVWEKVGLWLTPKGQEIAQAESRVGESRQKKLYMQTPQIEEELCVQESKTCNELLTYSQEPVLQNSSEPLLC